MKTTKTQDDKPTDTVEEVIPTTRTYFLPYEGKTIVAEDLADVETQLNKEKELEVGDGNS